MKMKPKGELQEYFSKDLGESAAILAKGIKLLRIERESEICWFFFNKADATPIAEKYWSGELQVNAKTYDEALRNLKTRIFSQK